MHFYYLFISSHFWLCCSFCWFGCFDSEQFWWWQHFSLQNSRTMYAVCVFFISSGIRLSWCPFILWLQGSWLPTAKRSEPNQIHNAIQHICCCVIPETFLLLFRLWACDCQCGMNEIRHGHIHPFEMKRKRWRSIFLRQLTSHLFQCALCLFAVVRSYLHLSLFECMCVCAFYISSKTTHFKCRLCAITHNRYNSFIVHCQNMREWSQPR